ncbi:glycoside hydrolase [Aureobasidium sp. EXF-10727]|nr:glycoside hydrolase [Aureobasidium sp. EXF-10727]
MLSLNADVSIVFPQVYLDFAHSHPEYAPAGQQQCPLNVCCSQYGYCGTTSDFCGTGCQNGCSKVSEPSCGGSSSDARRIGYYESWSYSRTCDSWAPEKIDASLWTHLNYAFALIDSSGKIASMNAYDTQLYPRVTGLKKSNANLNVFISVGGWAAGGAVFSKMVSTTATRATFINSAISFMNTYGFDGLDIDWEYPVAGDRGGAKADFQNYVSFLKELRAACGSKFGITLTLPSSYCNRRLSKVCIRYLQGFDVVNLEPYVDWFNFMSYDIHGTWDGTSPYTKSIVQPHTNLTEISQGLDLLWRNNIKPSKVVLGLGFYGRSFTLKDPSCKTPGCAFSGGGNPGTCTQTSGILSNAEIQRIIKARNLTPILDSQAGIKYITWDSNQWVSYDDEQTFTLKKNFANGLCLGGTMVWALDLDDPSTQQSVTNLNLDGLRSIGDNVDLNPAFGSQKMRAIRKQNNVNLITFWTDCMKNPVCPPGFRTLTTGHGKIFDADQRTVIADGCHGGWKGYNRALCVENTVEVPSKSCHWVGKAGSCKEQCPPNSILISQNSHVGDYSCNEGAYKSYCCDAIYSRSIQNCPGTNAGNALSGGLAPRVADINKFQNKGIGSGSNIGTAMECAAEVFPGVAALGLTVAGLYILNSLPGYWQLVGGIYQWRPQRNIVYPQPAPQACTTTVTSVSATTVLGNLISKTCSGNKYPNACGAYKSIISHVQGADTLVCPISTYAGNDRPAPTLWNSQHADAWRSWVPNLQGYKYNKCARDEYPPFRFLIGDMNIDYPQWIRFLPYSENSGAGQIWKGVCSSKARSSTNVQGGPASDQTCTEINHITYTVNAMTMLFTNMPPTNDDGLANNPCLPIITDDIGFALFTNDPWYGSSLGRGKNQYAYKYDPVPALTNGKTAPRNWRNLAKRELDFGDNMGLPDDIIVDEGNTTRKATDEELLEDFGLYRCTSENCDKEREALQVLGARELQDSVPRTRVPSAFATLSTIASSVLDVDVSGPAVRTGGATMPSESSVRSEATGYAQRHLHGHIHRRGH